MHPWELEALGVGDVREVDVSIGVDARYQRSGNRSGWMVSLFYAPTMWETWGVGLVLGTANFKAEDPVRLPDPVELALCERVRGLQQRHTHQGWRRAIASPVIVGGEALGFVMRGLGDDGRFPEASDTCEVVAPTRLDRRLRLEDGQPISLRLLSGLRYRRSS